MRVKRGGRDVKVEVRADGEGLVSHAGAALIAETADRLGLTSALDRALGDLFERAPTHSPGRVIRDLAVMLADGGDALCDLGAVRDQEALFGPVASDATAYRLIERIAADPDALERIRAARAEAARAGVAARRAAAADRDRSRRDAVGRAFRQGGRGGQLQGRLRVSPDAGLPGRLRGGARRAAAAGQRRRQHGRRPDRRARRRARAAAQARRGARGDPGPGRLAPARRTS